MEKDYDDQNRLIGFKRELMELLDSMRQSAVFRCYPQRLKELQAMLPVIEENFDEAIHTAWSRVCDELDEHEAIPSFDDIRLMDKRSSQMRPVPTNPATHAAKGEEL